MSGEDSISGTTTWYAILGFFGSLWLSTAFANICLFALLLVAIYEWKSFAQQIRSKWMLAVSLAWLAYLLLQGSYFALAAPDDAANGHVDALKDVTYLILSLLTGYWLARFCARQHTILLVGLGGLILALIVNQDWSQWDNMVEGIRSGQDLWHYPTMGLFASAGLFALVTIVPRSLSDSRLGPAARSVAYVGFAIALLLLGQALVVSQSRGAWVGFVLGALVLAAVMLRRLFLTHRLRVSQLATLASVLLLPLVLVMLNIGSITTRLNAEPLYLESMLEKDLGDVPFKSIGARIHLNVYGAELFAEKPITGWGLGVDALTLPQAKTKDPQLARFSHLHNTYLELLVRGGIIGFTLFLLFFVTLFAGTVRATLAGAIRQDLGLFLIASLLATSVWMFADFRLLRQDFAFFWVALIGLASSYVVFKPFEPGARVERTAEGSVGQRTACP